MYIPAYGFLKQPNTDDKKLAPIVYKNADEKRKIYRLNTLAQVKINWLNPLFFR
jgi:hypothetical protein